VFLQVTREDIVKGRPPTGLSGAGASLSKSHRSVAARVADTAGMEGMEGMVQAVMNSLDSWVLASSLVVPVAEDSTAESDLVASSGVGSQKCWRLEPEASGDERGNGVDLEAIQWDRRRGFGGLVLSGTAWDLPLRFGTRADGLHHSCGRWGAGCLLTCVSWLCGVCWQGRGQAGGYC
jgi:hypothetical protein